jgi:hypothetical protein
LRENDGKEDLSILFHSALQRVLMATGGVDHLSHLGLSDFESEDAADTHAVLVNMQHYTCRVFTRLIEKPLKNVDHELHGRVVVVQEENPIEGRLLRFRLDLGDDRRAHPISCIAGLALSHPNRSPLRRDAGLVN